MERSGNSACKVLFLFVLLTILGRSNATTNGFDELQCSWFNNTEGESGILRAWRFCDDKHITEYSRSINVDEEGKGTLAVQMTMIRQYAFLGTQVYPSILKRYTSYESNSSCPFGLRSISTTIQSCRLEPRSKERFSHCDFRDSN